MIFAFDICTISLDIFEDTSPYMWILFKALYIIAKSSGLKYVLERRMKLKRHAAFLAIGTNNIFTPWKSIMSFSFPMNLDD